MTKTTAILWMTTGAAAAIALILACGDDTHSPADAAKPDAPTGAPDANGTCDCKGFEPTITTGRIYRVRDQTKPPGGDTTLGIELGCKPGDMVLGGGCYTFEDGIERTSDQFPRSAGPDFSVLQSGPIRYYDTKGEVTGTKEGWECVFDADPARSDIHFEVTAICLDIKPD